MGTLTKKLFYGCAVFIFSGLASIAVAQDYDECTLNRNCEDSLLCFIHEVPAADPSGQCLQPCVGDVVPKKCNCSDAPGSADVEFHWWDFEGVEHKDPRHLVKYCAPFE